MQSKLAIAALVGAVSAKDLTTLKHAMVQAANTKLSHGIQDLTKQINKKIQKTEHALEDAQDLLQEMSDTAEDVLSTDVEVAVAPERSAVDV